jgi:peptidyl-tRNA hydrolase, PTH1 family
LRVVVGLGNPGKRYAQTRHNIGFLVLDHLAAQAGVAWRRDDDLPGDWAQTEGLGLLKPLTFMNDSGSAVAALMQRGGVEVEGLLVVFDDFELDFGRIRLRQRGSDGGHNGMASVADRVGSSQVPRLRLGIGKPPEGGRIIDYVLSPFAVDEDLDGLVERGGQAVRCYLDSGPEEAMNQFNGCAPL